MRQEDAKRKREQARDETWGLNKETMEKESEVGDVDTEEEVDEREGES